MPVRDHDPIAFEKFLGTFDRGEDESVPPGYFKSSQNISFVNQSVYTRSGLSVNLPTTFPIRRMAIYKRIGEAPRLLLLSSSGALFDSTNLSTPILSIPAMTDFSMVSMFNRAYITPHNGLTGLPGEKIYVYEGSGVVRPAAGSPPPSAPMTAVLGTAGPFDAGLHGFAVAYETQSGHVTGFSSFASLNCITNTQVNLSGIPIGPAGTVARLLVATKDITLGFTGDLTNQTYYYIPNGRIPNNTETSRTVSFYDADLQAEASQLVDQMQTIPAGVGINIYRGRLITWGEDLNASIVRASLPGQPESFDEAEGFCTVNPGDSGGGVKYCFEYRTQLICCKTQRSYITQDNGNPAALWEVNALDKSVGTECHGVGKILDFGEDVRDRAFVADRSGLQLFTGTFSDTEVSFNINDIWARINQANFHKIEVAVDPLEAIVYVAIPLDAATECSHLLVGDWQDGLTLEGMKFTLWAFPNPPSTIVVDVDSTKHSLLKVGSNTANSVMAYDKNAKLDYGQAIDSWVEFPLLPQGDDWPVNHFTGFRARIKGSGVVKTTLSSLDAALTQTAGDFLIAPAPGIPIFRGFNFSSERCSVKLRMNQPSEYFMLTFFALFYKELWMTRPEA